MTGKWDKDIAIPAGCLAAVSRAWRIGYPTVGPGGIHSAQPEISGDYMLDGPASFAYNLQTSTTRKLTRYIEPVAQIDRPYAKTKVGRHFHPHRRLERSQRHGRSPAAARSQHLSGSRPWKILGGLPGTATVGSLATTADCVNHCVRQSPTTARAGSKPRPVSAGPHC